VVTVETHASNLARLIATVADSFPKLNEWEQKVFLGLKRLSCCAA